MDDLILSSSIPIQLIYLMFENEIFLPNRSVDPAVLLDDVGIDPPIETQGQDFIPPTFYISWDVDSFSPLQCIILPKLVPRHLVSVAEHEIDTFPLPVIGVDFSLAILKIKRTRIPQTFEGSLDVRVSEFASLVADDRVQDSGHGNFFCSILGSEKRPFPTGKARDYGGLAVPRFPIAGDD